jgi:signal transduction histidine kinase
MEAVAYIRSEAHRLVDLLNQLLDFGQVEQGEPRLDREPLDLVSLARHAVEPWATLHPEVSFRLIHKGEVLVDGDFMKLHRVIANLLDNAVRHSPVGGTVAIEVHESEGSAVLAITDEGTGIPPRDRDRVFGRFVRLGSDGDPSIAPFAGAGIGLYIVKALVEAHGGTVEIEDAPGARFVIRFPVRAVETLAS